MHVAMDQLTTLKAAVAGSRFGSGEARLARRVRTVGIAAFNEVLDDLSRADLDRITEEAESLHARGVLAALMGSEEYPGP